MKLTLTQAQERLARFDGLAIDWTRPAEEAVRVAIDNHMRIIRLPASDVDDIVLTLQAYAAHLSFEEGKKYEAAATKRLIDQRVAYFERGENEADGQDVRLACGAKASALRSLASLIDDGFHYAKPETPPVAQPVASHGDDCPPCPSWRDDKYNRIRRMRGS